MSKERPIKVNDNVIFNSMKFFWSIDDLFPFWTPFCWLGDCFEDYGLEKGMIVPSFLLEEEEVVTTLFEGRPTNKTPCKTCAFRKDSPERQNKEDWQATLLGYAGMGQAFYCHYGQECTDEKWPKVKRFDKNKAVLCGGWYQEFGSDPDNAKRFEVLEEKKKNA